jgi:hypothetical protein
MKNLYLSLALLYSMISFGQLTLEHTYNSDTFYNNTAFNAFVVEDGIYYFTYNESSYTFSIYDQSHNFIKSFVAPLPAGSNVQLVWGSDKLFNTDSNFEFFIQSSSNDNGDKFTIVDDNGLLIQEINDRYFWKVIPFANSWKLMVWTLSDPGEEQIIDVYGLPGSLSVGQESLLLKEIVAFPNPANSIISILNPENLRGAQKIEVFDLSGHKVMEKEISNAEPYTSLDISFLSSGVYLYKVGTVSKKFIKG